MELRMNDPSLFKKLWGVLKIMIAMIRNGFVSKRKLLIGINVIRKRRNLIQRTLWNAIRHESRKDIMACRGRGYGVRKYEFLCGNSPDPGFSRVPNRRLLVIPCMNHPHVTEGIEEEEEEEEVGDRDYGNRVVGHEAAVVSVMTCDYSLEEDSGGTNRGEVDYKAEEFIRRFHEQLRMQLLQYGG